MQQPETSIDAVDEQLAAQLVPQARSQGVRLVGEGGLLQKSTKLVLENVLEGGDERLISATPQVIQPIARRQLPQRTPAQDGAYRDRTGRTRRAEDQQSSFEPKIGRKRQRRQFNGWVRRDLP
jgi:putative transposase